MDNKELYDKLSDYEKQLKRKESMGSIQTRRITLKSEPDCLISIPFDGYETSVYKVSSAACADIKPFYDEQGDKIETAAYIKSLMDVLDRGVLRIEALDNILANNLEP